MERKTVSGIMLALPLIGMLILVFNIQPVKASGTLYIGSDYTFASNIYEPIVVNADNITIDGNGYTLKGPGSGNGFDLNGRSNVTIKNVNIKGWGAGIGGSGIDGSGISGNNRIFGNNITNNRYGMYLEYSHSNTIAKNNIANNGDGIYFWGGCHNTITQNYIANNDCGIKSEEQEAYELGVISYNEIIQNNMTNNYCAISLMFADHSTIAQNNIMNNYFGINFDYYSMDNTIIQNNIVSNDVGIVSYESSSTITQNNITNNGVGIGLDCSSSIIAQNNITNNGNGISLMCAMHSTITQNNIMNNDVGINFEYYSTDNTIIQNNITNNGVGIELDESYYNAIYHNNFIDNTLQVWVRENPSLRPSINTWDNGYPSGGNHWSDYTGVDLFSGPFQNVTGGDGIGDTPYVIYDKNQDRYPFMNPWPMGWATACSVWTTDADGDPKVRFGPGETVYVHWSANGMVNMTVYAPDGVTVDQEWTCLLSGGVVSFVPSHGWGIYGIHCTGARPTPIAVSTFLVIPQLPFMGTLLALVTMLGAFFITKKLRSH